MRSKLPFYFGMDRWRLSIPLTFFLNQCLKQELEVMELKQTQKGLEFYTSILQRNRIRHLFPDAIHLRTSGAAGFLLHQFVQPLRLFSLALLIGCWLFYSHCIVSISYISTDQKIEKQIITLLQENGYREPFFSIDQNLAETMETLLKSNLEDQIGWLEVTKQGSRMTIQFTDKQYVETPQLSTEPIYAQKEGMVVRFDVQHGEKKVKINQIVKPGDLLIDASLNDAFDAPKGLYVKGKVFGYTWYTVQSSLVDSLDFPLADALAFFRLQMDCRAQIVKELGEQEKIIKENVLLFERNAGTITMKVHYTCLEDLTRP